MADYPLFSRPITSQDHQYLSKKSWPFVTVRNSVSHYGAGERSKVTLRYGLGNNNELIHTLRAA